MKAKGVHCQVWITITETMASRGSPSQFWLPSPALMARKSTMPNSGASMKVRQIMPTTAGDSTTGRIAMSAEQALAALHVHDQQRERQPNNDLKDDGGSGIDQADHQRRPEPLIRQQHAIILEPNEAVC